jgi:hypothetical protein
MSLLLQNSLKKHILPATSKEHIFNSSWGGSHKTGNLICNECNKSFSAATDRAFSVYVKAVMNAWSFRGERHPDVPKIDLEGDYFLDKGAKLKLKQPVIKDEIQLDGTIESRFAFNDQEQVGNWIKEGGMATWLGREPSADEKKFFKNWAKQAIPNRTDALPQPVHEKLNLREQYRSSAHTILKSLGFYLPEWVSNDLTKPIKNFARYNQGDWRFFAVNVEQFVSIAEQATRTLGLGVHHNSVEIYWCSSLKMIIGVLTLLNRVKRAVVIAKDYSGPDAILYVVENTHGSKKPPEAVFAELDPKQFSLPLLGVQYFASHAKTHQFFRDELASLMGAYYPIDAITASLIQGIEELNKKTPQLNETVLEEYVRLFLKFLLDMGKITGVQIEPANARFKLFEYGFSTLATHYIGRLCTDFEVESIVSTVFKFIMRDFELGTL